MMPAHLKTLWVEYTDKQRVAALYFAFDAADDRWGRARGWTIQNESMYGIGPSKYFRGRGGAGKQHNTP